MKKDTAVVEQGVQLQEDLRKLERKSCQRS